TIIDKDGDSSSASINLTPVIAFEDDAPSISAVGTPPPLVVDETILANNATASFASNFSSAFGADGAGNISYALSVVANSTTNIIDTATNEAVKLVLNAGVVEGRSVTTNLLVFTVAVDGSGNVTLDQMRAIVHSPDTGPDQ